MKTELKAKFLQHLLKKNEDKGFTLIELLVVIIIIGILAAIALPSFLNQANKARQSEAQTYVGSINRGQQAYYLENSAFGILEDLDLGITNTKNYTYESDPTNTGENPYAYTTAVISLSSKLKPYAGLTWVTEETTGGDATTLAIVCPGNPGDQEPPTLSGTQTTCPPTD
jgi:type II secretion system protein G